MALSTFVKISNVSNLSDARYCAGMGVNQLGFNLNPNLADSVSTELFVEIKNWVAGVDLVGEFGELPAAEITEIQKEIPLDFIEVSSIDHVEAVGLLGKPVIFHYHIQHQIQIIELKPTLSYLDELVSFMVITADDGSLFDAIDRGVEFYHGSIQLIKGYNVNPDNVAELNSYKGIQLKGSIEEKPGLKDYGQIMDVLEAIDID